MADPTRRPNLIRSLLQLRRQEDAKRQVIGAGELHPQLALLRRWQASRLAQTYADLLADPLYAPACRFFLSDIYAPRDFSQRDHDFQRLHSLLGRFLPAQSLQLLREGIELNRLSGELDSRLLQALIRLGMTAEITTEQYTEAYRNCANYAERTSQIQQLVHLIRQIGAGARLPAVGISLRLARGPAEAVGWLELYSFLERGYAAFRQMRDVETFAQAVEQRETRLMERIFAGERNPFSPGET